MKKIIVLGLLGCLFLFGSRAHAQESFACGESVSEKLEVNADAKGYTFTLTGTSHISMGKALGIQDDTDAVQLRMPVENCTQLQGHLITCRGVVEALSFQRYWTKAPFTAVAPRDLYLGIRQVRKINFGNFGKVEDTLEVEIAGDSGVRTIFKVANQCQ